MTHQQDVADRLAQLRREKSAREKRDVLQGEIAEEIGIAQETYSRYENGKRKVPREIVYALAKYFRTTPEFIDYGVRNVIVLGGLEIDRATITTFSDEELSAWKDLVGELEVRKATPPSRKSAGDGPQRRK